MKLEFRKLRADEIDCRVQSVKQKGLILLLYKDARCDQNILDETIGPLSWQRRHSRDNANCTVSIWDDSKNQWIEKEDTGTESNTEAEKGLASDSFKRACFNWGIGRELYTSPFIWVPADKAKIDSNKCYDSFSVASIGYSGNSISELAIWNDTQHCWAFQWKERPPEWMTASSKAQADTEPSFFQCEACGKRLAPYPGKDGKPVPLRAHAERSRQKFGRVLCLDCINTLKERENA